MVTRKCAQCGESFQAKRESAKYCNSSCRARFSQTKKARIRVGKSPTPAATPPGGGLLEAVRAELERADRLNTVAGQHAMELADRIVNAPGMNTGVAAISKQLQAVLAEALQNVTVVADPVDELEARRDVKRQRAAG